MIKTIKCENCGHDNDLAKAVQNDCEISSREFMKKQELQLRKSLEKEFEEKLQIKTEKQVEELEMKLDEVISESNKNKAMANKARDLFTKNEEEMLRMQERIEEYQLKERSLQRIQKDLIASAVKEATEEVQKQSEYELKKAYKEIDNMKNRIKELQNASVTMPQNHQGDISEEMIFSILKEEYPTDNITRVNKGQAGGDIHQKVITHTGKVAGNILWEIKDTASYSSKWESKLGVDLQKCGADYAVIVSRTMPSDGKVSRTPNIWVIRHDEVPLISSVLRRAVAEIYRSAAIESLTNDKKDLIFDLVLKEMGPFIERLVTNTRAQRQIFEKQKRSMNKLWKEGEKIAETQDLEIVGFWGALKGIAGNSIKEIESFED